MVGRYFDRDGAPISATRLSDLLSDPDYKRVARSEVISLRDPGRMVTVSTVWLGVDHSPGAGPPLIFECMAFADTWAADDCARYSTLADAYVGHRRMVVAVAEAMGADVQVIDHE